MNRKRWHRTSEATALRGVLPPEASDQGRGTGTASQNHTILVKIFQAEVLGFRNRESPVRSCLKQYIDIK